MIERVCKSTVKSLNQYDYYESLFDKIDSSRLLNSILATVDSTTSVEHF